MMANGLFRPGMRAYVIPCAAGLVLAASAFLPWVIVGGTALPGVPDGPGLWVAGLGVVAAVLAVLSLVTRKNSRHPILLVGLLALGVTGLSSRLMPRLAAERARTVSQAFAIVEERPFDAAPTANVGSGL